MHEVRISFPIRKVSKTIAHSVLSAVLVLGMAPAVVFADDADGVEVTSAEATAVAAGQSDNATLNGGNQPTPPDGERGGDNPPTPPDGDGGGGGSNTQTFDYTGTYSGVLVADGTTVTSKSKSLVSTTKDENVVLAENAGTATVTGATITKSGDDTDGDTCNFYGVNSSVLAVGDGSIVNISDSTISSTSVGSNGLFAADYGRLNANNLSITTTTGNNSRGLDATYKGVIVANKATISTAMDHCAAVATDRGGGYVSVSNSVLNTAGSGSPLLYSTGDVEADHVTGTATGSQIAGMEGYNIIRINDSSLVSINDARSGSDPIKDGIIIYQSTSGDADTSVSTASDFQVSDSSLTSSISSGAMFYITNTTANVVLSNTVLSFDSSAVELLHASGNSNSWGTSGSNGGTVTFTGIGQTLAGKVYVDSISSADIFLTSGSTWTGTVADTNTSGDGTTATPGNATVNVDGTSTWVVNANTSLGKLNLAGGGKIVDSTGATATIVNSVGTVLVQGTGSVTVTVTDTYSTTLGTAAGSISGASSELSSARSSFDTLYATSTSWDTNENAAMGYTEGSDEESGEESDEESGEDSVSGATIKTHVQDYGTIDCYYVNGKKTASNSVYGTMGESKRMEAVTVTLTGADSKALSADALKASAHIQDYGWVDYGKANGVEIGTEGESKRIEAMTFELSDTLKTQGYSICYRVHVQDIGWMGWASDGEMAGTAGMSKRIEAIQIAIIDSDGETPAATYDGVTQVTTHPAIDGSSAATWTEDAVSYTAVAHIQNIGDTNFTTNGSDSLGTTGRSLRIEALTLNTDLDISYSVHVENIGWMSKVSDGQMAGTTGQSKRLEAVTIALEGTDASLYDVYYRTHVQNIGWTGWTVNGAQCGSAGYGYRMEALQVVIVPKDATAPGMVGSAFYQA